MHLCKRCCCVPLYISAWNNEFLHYNPSACNDALCTYCTFTFVATLLRYFTSGFFGGLLHCCIFEWIVNRCITRFCTFECIQGTMAPFHSCLWRMIDVPTHFYIVSLLYFCMSWISTLLHFCADVLFTVAPVHLLYVWTAEVFQFSFLHGMTVFAL